MPMGAGTGSERGEVVAPDAAGLLGGEAAPWLDENGSASGVQDRPRAHRPSTSETEAAQSASDDRETADFGEGWLHQSSYRIPVGAQPQPQPDDTSAWLSGGALLSLLSIVPPRGKRDRSADAEHTDPYGSAEAQSWTGGDAAGAPDRMMTGEHTDAWVDPGLPTWRPGRAGTEAENAGPILDLATTHRIDDDSDSDPDPDPDPDPPPPRPADLLVIDESWWGDPPNRPPAVIE